MNTECVYDKDVYTSWMKKTKQSVFLYVLRILSYLVEQIAVCNEVVVSKLARSDYPDSW